MVNLRKESWSTSAKFGRSQFDFAQPHTQGHDHTLESSTKSSHSDRPHKSVPADTVACTAAPEPWKIGQRKRRLSFLARGSLASSYASMGRINLAALRVRSKAMAYFQAGRTQVKPEWAEIMANVPPAQIYIRHQPLKHPVTETRTTQLPNGKGTQITRTIAPPPKSKIRRPKHIYSPRHLRYEEDALRDQFFRDHPWELARPRLLVETDGDQHAHADWSTGLQQPGIPVSGESVAQRQLWLLQNKPNMTVPEAYDIARKEFYAIRRRQQIAQRVAIEEAENNGADFGVPTMSRGMTKEAEMFDEWVVWAEKENMALMQRQASFAGQQPGAETAAVQANSNTRPGQGTGDGTLGTRFNGTRQGWQSPSVLRESKQIGQSLSNATDAFIERQRQQRPIRQQ